MINLAQAVGIVIIVLLLFMGLRSGLIIGTVLLVTIITTFIFMPLLGVLLERVSLGALIIALGMLVDKPANKFGKRSWRYSALVNNGVIEKMFVEPGKKDDAEEDPYGMSSPENVLKYLQNFKG